MRVTLIAIDSTFEAQTLRAVLEHLGCEVRLALPGKPSDFLAAFDFFGQVPDFVIICAHGDTDGLIFPAMAPGVDSLVLENDRISAALVAKRLKMPATIVLSTACDSGTRELVDAFTSAGAKTYLAPAGAPDGADIPLFVHMLFHRLYHRHLGLNAALTEANAQLSPQSTFVMFTADAS